MEKQLRRNPGEGALAGVCAGLGEYLSIDKTWIRLFFVSTIFFSVMGVGLAGPVIYIILWIVLPEKPVVFPSSPFSGDYPPISVAEDPSKQGPSPRKRSKDRRVAGILLLIIGLVFLLHQFDLILWSQMVRFWPAVIILLGVFTIIRAFKDNIKI